MHVDETTGGVARTAFTFTDVSYSNPRNGYARVRLEFMLWDDDVWLPRMQNHCVLAVAARSGQESGHGAHVTPASLPGSADGQRSRLPSRRSHRRGRCSHQTVETAEQCCTQPLTSRMRTRYCYWWMGFCPLRLVAGRWIASLEFSEVSCGPAAHKRNLRVPLPDAIKSPEPVRYAPWPPGPSTQNRVMSAQSPFLTPIAERHPPPIT